MISLYDKSFLQYYQIDISRLSLLNEPPILNGINIKLKDDIPCINIARDGQIEWISSFDSNVFRLMLFYEQFSKSYKVLPIIPLDNIQDVYIGLLNHCYTDTIQHAKALNFLRNIDIEKLNSYDNFKQIIYQISEFKDISDALEVTKLGNSLSDYYFGDSYGYSATKFRQLDNNEWQRYSIEKCYEYGTKLIFFDIKYAYFYIIVFFYLNAI